MAHDDNVVFEDSENWSSKTIGIKEIALEQFRRCMTEGSKNFNSLDGKSQKEIFINSVKGMEIILYPKLLDKKNFPEVNTNIVENEKSIEDLKERYKQTYERLQEKAQPINENLLKENYETELLELYRKKLIILSILLDKLNYFCEGGIDD